MCTTEGSMPGSVAEALRMAHAGLDYLNSPAAADLPAAACGQALAALGEVQAKATAAHAALLRRFDALDGHDADGYGTSSAWLAAMSKMTGPDAKAAVRQMRQLTGRPAAWCDVHHITHKKGGGKTSATDCVALCQFHHDVCIHRWGWRIVLHPDGTTSAFGPHGQVLHSHSPPTVQAE